MKALRERVVEHIAVCKSAAIVGTRRRTTIRRRTRRSRLRLRRLRRPASRLPRRALGLNLRGPDRHPGSG